MNTNFDTRRTTLDIVSVDVCWKNLNIFHHTQVIIIIIIIIVHPKQQQHKNEITETV